MSAGDCPAAELLQAFQLGNLPEPSLSELARHLEGCARCEALAQQLDAAVDPLLAALRQPGPPAAHTQMLQPGRATPAPAAGHTSAPPRPAAAPLAEIGRLGHYRILELLGRGGMATVYRAEDMTLRRTVALKVMRTDLGAEVEGWQRFLREARIMAAIKHVNLVTVYQVGQDGARGWLAMELLTGESLAARLERAAAPESPAVLLRLAGEITSGLASVHAHGLVHRDLKPANIWVEAPADRIKILDFGLARFVRDSAKLTRPGTVMGTPAFMAPEQARGEPTDARSDLFSLGCVLYTLCTGLKPFDGENTMLILEALARHQPPPVYDLNPTLPRELSDLVMQLLEKSPDRRPATAQAVLQRLRQLATGNLSPTGELAWASLPSLPEQNSVQPTSRSRRLWVALWSASMLLGALATSWWYYFMAGASPGSAPSASASAKVPVPAVFATIPGVLYLTDLQERDPVNWPFRGSLPDQLVPEPGEWPTPKGGRRVRVQQKVALHGIWMHLPPAQQNKVTSISYQLGGQYRTFNTEISLNDGPPTCTPLTFRVYGNGKVLWTSRPVESQADAQSCRHLSVRGIDKLTLEVSGQGEERSTHAVWIEPYLTR